MKFETPGINSFPLFALQCSRCKKKFELIGTYEKADVASCPSCGSNQIKEQYISFPEDGPGYQEDYTEKAEGLRNGCGGPSEAQLG